MNKGIHGIDRKKLIAKIAVFATLASLFIFVFLPSFFLISFTFTKWPDVYTEVFANPFIGDTNWIEIQKHLALSLRLAFFAVMLDLLFGIPLAYLLARKKFWGKGFLEDLITFTLVIPTSGFGFATVLTWTTTSGLGYLIGRGIVDIDFLIPLINVPFMMLIVHIALTFPYIVRTLQAKLEDLEPVFEQASRTLGAFPLTTFRKIVFPLTLPAIFSGGVLAFARSLGETGATMVVSSIYTTAPIAVIRWVSQFKFGSASFLGCLLIVVASAVILPVEFVLQKRGGPTFRFFSIRRIEKKILKTEKFVSRRLSRIKDVISLIFILLIVILPIIIVLNSVALSWSHDPDTGRVEGSVLYQLFGPSNYFASLLKATMVSFASAFVATYVATCIAIPTVFLIERHRLGRFIRSMLRIPLIVPTSALGLSILLLWGPGGLKLVNPGVWLIVLTHIVFSVPVVVEPIIATFEGSEIPMFEGAARTLGATPYNTMETISLPLLKRGILTGFILSFTRSLGETGATFLVMGSDVTIPPLVVNMVEALAIPAALFASTYLIALSFVLLLVFRMVTKR
ncbi:MAG: ABC transporter permease subunit [Candidatus Bathyarchaeota archaeon]|nr:ABC transporter permease subunit [Candidatus Bathyarchaeota archaeon]MDH5733381.1 ABC transporter permease subunit [Candidatus Bathyarchaeota archaeon]